MSRYRTAASVQKTKSNRNKQTRQQKQTETYADFLTWNPCWRVLSSTITRCYQDNLEAKGF